MAIAQNNSQKASGAMVGLAIGDAMGKATEGVPKKIFDRAAAGIREFRKAPENHPCFHLGANQYTDDTQQAVLLAESIVDRQRVDINDFGWKIAIWGEMCRTVPNFDRWAGNTSLEAAKRIFEGREPRHSGSLSTESNGSAMRSAPVGIAYPDSEVAFSMGKQSSVPTHASQISQDAAGFVAGMISSLVHSGAEPAEAVQSALAGVKSEKFAAAIRLALMISRLASETAEAILGTGTNASQSVAFALYSFLHTPKDFEATMVTAVNIDKGDSDTIAAIAGAFSGAYNGLSEIPVKFLSVENFEYIKGLGEKLYELSQAAIEWVMSKPATAKPGKPLF